MAIKGGVEMGKSKKQVDKMENILEIMSQCKSANQEEELKMRR